MSRFPQTSTGRGSLKWIQRAVNVHPQVLDVPLLAAIPGARSITWLSPRHDDSYAEYRDAAFLDRLGLQAHAPALADFWPARGPQWDALGRTENGEMLLAEAKAHVRELLSAPTQASAASRQKIDRALQATANAFGAEPGRPWAETYYQLANRLAHLHFLTTRGVPARLVLVNFVGDDDVNGPDNEEHLHTAYRIAHTALGLPDRHGYSDRVVKVFPNVRDLS